MYLLARDFQTLEYTYGCIYEIEIETFMKIAKIWWQEHLRENYKL